MYQNPVLPDFIKSYKLREMFKAAVPISASAGVVGALFLVGIYDQSPIVSKAIFAYMPKFQESYGKFQSFDLQQKLNYLNSNKETITHMMLSFGINYEDILIKILEKLSKKTGVKVQLIHTVDNAEKSIIFNANSNLPTMVFYFLENTTFFMISDSKPRSCNIDEFTSVINPFTIGFSCGHSVNKIHAIRNNICPVCEKKLYPQEMDFYGTCSFHNAFGLKLECNCVYCLECVKNIQQIMYLKTCKCMRAFRGSDFAILACFFENNVNVVCKSCKRQDIGNSFYQCYHELCNAICNHCALMNIFTGRICEDCQKPSIN